MGAADLKDYIVKKASKPEGVAGTISCCTCIVGILFFIITFSIGMFSGGNWGNILITSIIKGGMDQSPPAAPYPQITFCPLWPEGSISNIVCSETNKTWFSPSSFPLHAKIVGENTYSNRPDWKCYAYNFNGDVFPNADYTMFCSMNSTNYDPSKNVTWDGRVRVFIDKPGTTTFNGCTACVDGIDGTILVAKTTSLVFFQSSIISGDGIDVVDYKTSLNRMPTQPQLGEVSDMDAVFGFFSKDVWTQRSPKEFSSSLAGEGFSRFIAFVGGVAIASWGLYAFLSTFLILLVVGDSGLPATGGEKRSLLP